MKYVMDILRLIHINILFKRFISFIIYREGINFTFQNHQQYNNSYNCDYKSVQVRSFSFYATSDPRNSHKLYDVSVKNIFELQSNSCFYRSNM